MELTEGAGGGGFSVRAGDLAAGSGQVLNQRQRCEQVATAVGGLIAQMAGAAGHPGLTGALVRSETRSEVARSVPSIAPLPVDPMSTR